MHGPVTKGTTTLEAIRSATEGRATVTYDEDGKVDGNFDVVIAVIGENPYAETHGDRAALIIGPDPEHVSVEDVDTMRNRSNQINIRPNDMDMLWEAYDYDCPVIVIMLSGRPMTIGDEYLHWDAFIAAWLPGTEGTGITDVLFGNRNFTGRTPYTWRKTINGEILFPFGYGLTK
jgi:beta-glucosidase